MCRENLRIQRDGNFKASTNSVVVLYRNRLDKLESYGLLRTHLFSFWCSLVKKNRDIHIYPSPQYHAQEKEGRRRKERKEKEDKMHALKDISYSSELPSSFSFYIYLASSTTEDCMCWVLALEWRGTSVLSSRKFCRQVTATICVDGVWG